MAFCRMWRCSRSRSGCCACASVLLPEIDLASQTLRTLGNGLLTLCSYMVVGRFLLAPDHPERRLVPLPRAEHHFHLLAIYAGSAMVAASAVILSERAGVSKLPLAGLFTVLVFAVTVFKLWWFYDARHDLHGLILSNSERPGPGLRLLALAAPWFYMAVAVAIWMVGRASAMMLDGVLWAETAAVTQIVVFLAPVIALGVPQSAALPAGASRCNAGDHAAGRSPVARRRGSSDRRGLGDRLLYSDQVVGGLRR